MNEFKCEICGRSFKSSSGLAGHRQFVHGSPRAVVNQDPDVALTEVLSAVQETMSGLQGQVNMLKAQLDITNERLNDFHSTLPSTGQRQDGAAGEAAMVLLYEQSQEQVKALGEQLSAVKAELAEWQTGHRFVGFNLELHSSDPVSKSALDEYTRQQRQDAIDNLTEEQVRTAMPKYKIFEGPETIKIHLPD